MDIYSIFSVFLTPETGLLIMCIISLMEFIIKPILSRFKFRSEPWFKKSIIPLIVLALSVGLSFVVAPVSVSGVGSIIIYGIGAGMIATWIYRTGLSNLSNKLGIETIVKDSIFPPNE